MHAVPVGLVAIIAVVCFIHLTRLVWLGVGAAMRICAKAVRFIVRAVGTCLLLFWLAVAISFAVWFVMNAIDGQSTGKQVEVRQIPRGRMRSQDGYLIYY